MVGKGSDQVETERESEWWSFDRDKKEYKCKLGSRRMGIWDDLEKKRKGREKRVLDYIGVQ